MLVEPQHLIHAREDVIAKGNDEALAALNQSEPALASFLFEGLVAVAGKLSLSGAPTPLVQGAHEDLLALTLTCVQALRRGHYDLWKDSMTGTRLAQLDLDRPAKPRRRRKRSDEGNAEQGPG
jgi:hypothetical protein